MRFRSSPARAPVRQDSGRWRRFAPTRPASVDRRCGLPDACHAGGRPLGPLHAACATTSPGIVLSPLQKELLSAFESLPERDQHVLELLAVSGKPDSRTNLMELANAAGLRGEGGLPFKFPEWKLLVAKFLSAGLLDQEKHHVVCGPSVCEMVVRRAGLAGRFERWADACEPAWSKRRPQDGYRSYFYSSIEGWQRDFRRALHLDRPDEFSAMLEAWQVFFCSGNRGRTDPVLEACANPFDKAWLATRSVPIQVTALERIIADAVRQLSPAHDPVSLLADLVSAGHAIDWARQAVVEHYLLAGDPSTAAAWTPSENTAESNALRGCACSFRGEDRKAIKHFESAIASSRAETGKRDIVLPGLSGVLYTLALLRTNETARIAKALRYCKTVLRKKAVPSRGAYEALFCAATLASGSVKEAETLRGRLRLGSGTGAVDDLLMYAVQFWVTKDTHRNNASGILGLASKAHKGGYAWIAAECAELLRRLTPEVSSLTVDIRTLADMGAASVLDAVRDEQPWERGIAALEALGERSAKSRSRSGPSTRLVWQISGSSRIEELIPIEQKQGKGGSWAQGRAVSLKRLHSGKTVSYLTPQDAQICSAISRPPAGLRSFGDYHFYLPEAVLALIGHPLVFRADAPSTRVEIVRAEPTLRVRTSGGMARVKLVPEPPAYGDVVNRIESPTRVSVYVFEARHRNIFEVVGPGGLAAPAESKDRVARAVSSVSAIIDVQSDIATADDGAVEVAADPRPHLHLTPHEEGLRAVPFVRPFSDDGPTYSPGKGGEVVFASVNGKRSKTRRVFATERRRLAEVASACGALGPDAWDSAGWNVPEPEACLELLAELQALGKRVQVAWPQGETLRIRSQASTNRLALKIRKRRDWFQIEGTVDVDEGLVLNLRELLAALPGATGRFVPLDGKHFLALTDRFRRRLEELAAYADPHGSGLRFHSARALALEALVEEAGAAETDKGWDERVERFREAQALEPSVPTTLQAELRAYQVQGFRWAARLAAWGAGACLADDMGLGKTIQALAVALSRAPSGPTLVVAPTSVCPNWIAETRRFAPTLRPIAFGPGNREQTLKDLEPFDLLVCSYGLLHQEAERLADVSWETIVLDEAQAIKNRDTMRSRAAMALHGSFKMITTGTPIENHLGELWNLFQFINPGLLGSAESFSERYATPIHQRDCPDAKGRLKRLIQPFLLRRTKAAVLEELPARTEITLRVEMSDAERALYEAARRRAVDRLEQENGNEGPGHLQVLAEIMKLRRACCHPRLILPDADIAASKLEAFSERVAELLENGHKALVFSQFVDHLAIVRERLDRQGIAYRYLDGSTPVRERKRQVDAFQAGDGDLFLISLRAGGQGLNLTAADYVLHLDPWWNPAVEDQASDRAHRIGQTRPVTIYRLVMKGSIEERILDLHATKRNLADSLLDGSDLSGKISADELLELIRHG